METTNRPEHPISKETSSDPKRHLYETLRPSEEIAQKIQNRVEATARDIADNDPHPEMKRVMEAATGIFLWEQMVIETGEALPAGLVFTEEKSWNNKRSVAFDTKIISGREYAYALTRLQQEGVLDEVTALQTDYQKEHHEKLVEAMENLLRNSEATDFFDSFSIKSQQELLPRDLKPHEELLPKTRFESTFKEKYASLLKGQTLEGAIQLYGSVVSAYKAEVATPLAKKRHETTLSAEDDAAIKKALIHDFDERWGKLSGGTLRTAIAGQPKLRGAYEAEVSDALTQIPQEETDEKRMQLEGEFRQKWADDLGSISSAFENARQALGILPEAYKREVTRPLALATINKDQQESAAKNHLDPARTRFRKFLGPNFYEASSSKWLCKGEDDFERRLAVKDGKFVLRFTEGEWNENDEDGKQTPGKGEKLVASEKWEYFASDCVFPLRKDLDIYASYYPTKALSLLGPRLYDPKETRDFKTIVAEGITETAELLVNEINNPSHTLDGQYWMLTTRDRLIWLTNVVGPSADDTMQTEGNFYKTNPRDAKKRYNHLSEQTRYNETVGYIASKQSPVSEVPQRLISITQQNTNLPSLPPEQADLIIDFNKTFLTPTRYRHEKEITFDPKVEGMVLVARKDNQCYFQLDSENPEYQIPPVEIPYINRLMITDYCREIGMEGLANQITQGETLTLPQLITTLKQHVKLYTPQEEKPLETNDSGWAIDEEGRLLGDSKIFNEFLQSVLTNVYSNIKTEHGKALTDKSTITDMVAYQTRLHVPREDINCLLDITPDPAEDLDDRTIPNAPRPENWEGKEISNRETPFEESIHMQPLEPMSEAKFEEIKELLLKNLANTELEQLLTMLLKNVKHESLIKLLEQMPSDANQASTETNKSLAKLKERLSDQQWTENKLKVSSVEETEKEQAVPLADVLFAEPIVFQEAQQRLITPTLRDYAITNLDAIDFDTVDLLLSFSDTRLVDTDTDPSIAGMVLVGRDDKTREYAFRVDPESRIYQPILEEISPNKRQEVAELCLQAGMNALAKDITEPDTLTIDGLRSLVRKYSKPWQRKGVGIPPFTANSLQDLADNGLIDEQGNVQGECDAFEFTMRQLLTVIDPEAKPTLQGGYSLHDSNQLDIQLHAQTLYKGHLIDVEPDQSKAEIESERETIPAPQLSKEPQLVDIPTMPFTIPEPKSVVTEKAIVQEELLEKHANAAFGRFTLELDTYLELPHNMRNPAVQREHITKKLGGEMNKWLETTVLHRELWRVFDSYNDWKFPKHAKKPTQEVFILPDTLPTLKKWLTFYKERKAPLQAMIKQGRVPDYDPKFVDTMEQVVMALESWKSSK